MSQTAGSFDLTVCLNIKIWWWHFLHIRWNSWVYPAWHACPRRAGQAYWCVRDISSSLPTPSDPNVKWHKTSRLCQTFIYILLNPKHYSKL